VVYYMFITDREGAARPRNEGTRWTPGADGDDSMRSTGSTSPEWS
jgi:hypothetical protein